MGDPYNRTTKATLRKRSILLIDLSSTFSQRGRDAETTEEEFKEVPRRSGKDTAPGPDRIRYLNVKNQQKKSGLSCTLSTKKALTKAEYWTDSFLRPIPKPEKDHRKLNEHRIITLQNTDGKLMCQDTRQRPQGQGDIPENRDGWQGSDQENAH